MIKRIISVLIVLILIENICGFLFVYANDNNNEIKEISNVEVLDESIENFE